MLESSLGGAGTRRYECMPTPPAGPPDGAHPQDDQTLAAVDADRIVIVPAGVFVVDSKRWSGRIEITSGQKQAARIDTALRAAAVDYGIVCRAAMCFVESEWPLLGSSDHRIGRVHLCPPRTLYSHLQAPGTRTDDDCRSIAQILASAFPVVKTTRRLPAVTEADAPCRGTVSGRSR